MIHTLLNYDKTDSTERRQIFINNLKINIMTTFLSIIAVVVIISTLYILKDTITEALSGGKSFSPNETKPFV